MNNQETFQPPVMPVEEGSSQSLSPEMAAILKAIKDVLQGYIDYIEPPIQFLADTSDTENTPATTPATLETPWGTLADVLEPELPESPFEPVRNMQAQLELAEASM